MSWRRGEGRTFLHTPDTVRAQAIMISLYHGSLPLRLWRFLLAESTGMNFSTVAGLSETRFCKKSSAMQNIIAGSCLLPVVLYHSIQCVSGSYESS